MKPSGLFLSYLLPIFVIALFLAHRDIASALVNDRTITINTPEEITSKRQALILFTWGAAGFPNGGLPSSVQQNVPSPVDNLNNLERVDTLHITMDAGLTGLAHHFIPWNKNNRLVVFHQGHACTFDDGPGSGNHDYGMQRTMNALLSEGFSVLAVYMPHERPDDCTGNHDQMFNLVTTGSPMKFFLEPVVVSLNYLKINYPNYWDFSMVGLSGGGWTTTVYAAIDSRITLSIPVAGTIPLYLRFNYNHDEEQYLPSFYGIAGYPDLYVLGSYGSGRKQIQILNRHDDCCFGELQHDAAQAGASFEAAVRNYEARVKTSLNTLNAGFFRLYIDEVAPSHMISDNAIINVIRPVLNGTNNLVTTISAFPGGNFCLDVPDYGRLPQNGDHLQIFQCHGGPNQQFRLLDDGTIRTVRAENMCLDVPDYGRPPQDGDPIQIFQCHGDSNQQFSVPGDETIRAPQLGNMCLDAPDYGGSPQDGDPIQIFQCHGGSNQRWSVNR